MKFTVEFDLSDKEQTLLRQNSIERVLNNAIHIGAIGEKELNSDMDRNNASTLWQDCEDLKPVIHYIWVKVQSAVRAPK